MGVICPTREIAIQGYFTVMSIAQNAKVLDKEGREHGVKVNLSIGGYSEDDSGQSIRSTYPDKANIIIGTPGQIKTVLTHNPKNPRNKRVMLDCLRLMCFDEADQLFEDGNLKDQIDTIIRKSRIPSRCQFLGLSATFTESLKERLMILMNEYIYLNTDDFDQNGNKNAEVSNGLEGVLQYAITLPSCQKPRQTLPQKIEVASQIIKICPYTQCMMFCSNRRRAET